ncbi:MAG: acyl-CoA dehydrogenase family protein [Polyangiaceae bacterium]|nr:acyl-CoA dehydrogenase family protein [Polyangiaceae bacterium]
MANFFTDNQDLRFHFEEAIDWAPLVEISELGFRSDEGFKTTDEAVAFYRDAIESVGELSATQIAPRAAQMDREGARLEGGEPAEQPALRAIMQAIKDAELHRMCLPRELGGLNVPLLAYFLSGELIARADVSVMTHHSFHGGMAMAMLAFSIHEGTTTFDGSRIASTRFSNYIEEIARGDAWGCMDITEPNAGSDMAALRTRAELGSDGRFYLTGQKIFITSGHGKYHFVIARTEEATDAEDPFSGLGGLSMFLVKAYEDRPDGTRERFVTIDRVEEKLGHHGSVTAALSFDRTPAELIGKRGEGFKYMLMLMNNARIGVGFESIGLAENAYRTALAYAEERHSMGKPLAQHEMIADMLDEMSTDIQVLRALAVDAAWCEEIAQKRIIFGRFAGGSAGEKDREVQRLRARSRRLTPLLKYLAAEKAVEITRRAIQIHGGVGYTKDYSVEKLLRDAVVMPIYEGTSQIQALMVMKDTLTGAIKRPSEFLSRIAETRLAALRAPDVLDRRVARIQSLSLSAQQHLLTRTAAGKLRALSDLPLSDWRNWLKKGWDPKRDFSLAMLHAERLTRICADEAIAEILVAQAKKHPARRELAERFLDRAELRARAVHEEITTTGSRILGLIGAVDR